MLGEGLLKINKNKEEIEKLQKPTKIRNEVKINNEMINNEKVAKSSLQRYFAKEKNRDTAIFKSDYFSIYTIPQIQKHLNNPTDSLEDIRKRSDRNFDKLIPHIVDKRSIPIKYERTVDYFDFPTNRVTENEYRNINMTSKYING